MKIVQNWISYKKLSGRICLSPPGVKIEGFEDYDLWNIFMSNIIQEKPLHSPHVTVWCAMSGHTIIGPYFFEDSQGANISVTYLTLKNFLHLI